MHKNALQKLSRFLKAAVLVLVSAQILTGLVWGFLNCITLQNFPDTAELVKLSGTLYLKGDTGIVYPALLIVVRALTAYGIVRFYHVMYLIQLVLAFTAWSVFGKNVLGIDGKRKNAFFALAVVTNPFAMQVHLAVLEYSFISSFLCLLISFQIRFAHEWRNAENSLGLERALRDVSVTSLFWLLTALTRKEFIIIGFIPVLALLITVVKSLVKNKAAATAILWPVIVTLAFAGIICMSDSLFREGERISAADVVKRSLYYRVAWSENFRDRYHWPEYLTEFTDEGMMTHIMNDPGLVRTEYTEYVVDIYGSKTTTDLFYKWAKESFSDNKKNIVKDCISDIVGYIFAPLKTEMVLCGVGDSGFAAGNYDIMRQHNPCLTKVYLRYFSILYTVFAVIGIAALAIKTAKTDKSERRIKTALYMPVVLMILCMAACYTFMGCNMFDHRKVVFVTCLWMTMGTLPFCHQTNEN